MDGHRFDRLTRTLSSRRTALGGLLGGMMAALGAPITDDAVAAAPCPRGKKRCQGQCIPKRKCCTNANCRPKGSGKVCQNGTCRCPRAKKLCRGKCIPRGRCCTSADCPAGSGTACQGGVCRCPAVTCNGTCCAGGQQCFGTACWPDGQETAFVTLLNNHRAANGRPPLTLQNQLGRAAELHSQDQAVINFSSHTGSDGSTPAQRLTRVGYAFSWEAENIYWSSGGGTATDAFNWWRDSPEHNANMLSTNVTQFGIGRALSSSGVWYWTTSFGHPA